MLGTPVTIDPRRHDAVLLDLAEPGSAETLSHRLRRAGVQVAPAGADPGATAAGLAVRPGRCVVLTDTTAGVGAARRGGFALVIGVRPADSDAVVGSPDEVAVRAGDQPMSALPNAMTAPEPATPAHPALFFDFDGTLSDIVEDPGAARLADGAGDALRALAGHCPVAVLSGRDLDDVRARVGLSGIWYAGSHGFELTGPDGTHHQNEAAAGAVPVLTDAAADLRARLGSVPGVAVEHKRFAVAVHYRNAARDRVAEVTAAVRDLGRARGLRVTTGREVIELRPELDWDKGATLRWLLERLPDRLLPVFIGDDITDEDAFDAVRAAGGVGIIVRHGDDGDRRTAARFALDSPAQVVEFIARLADLLAGR